MSTRKCAACEGSGKLWETPFGFGTVTCWRCLGKGFVPQDNQDEGDTNG